MSQTTHHPGEPTPVIVHLSGRLRGRTLRLAGTSLRIGVDDGSDVCVPIQELSDATLPLASRSPLVSLRRHGASYVVSAAAGLDLWINGVPAQTATLASGDVLELGPGGPILRFRLYPPGVAPWKSLKEAFSDCLDCTRHGPATPAAWAAALFGGPLRELATQTAPLLRAVMVLAMVGLLVLTASLWRRSSRVGTMLTAELQRIDGLEALLQRTRSESFSMTDFALARGRLEEEITAAANRLSALETRAGARLEVISASSGSVMFLQGGFGFEDPKTSRPLRFAVREDGTLREDEEGAPLFSLDGSGPPVEIQYTGTAFAVSPPGRLISNRHVTSPWEFDDAARAVLALGLRPVRHRFLGYLPGRSQPFQVEIEATSDTVDIALLRVDGFPRHVPPLQLGASSPRVGDEIILLGYPVGMEALLARAEASFLDDLKQAPDPDVWTVAQRLAVAGYIAPLATVGIVGQVTPAAVVYDATTTHGGSGGPVLDLDGRVVAVNTAILADFSGSNIGVPIEAVRELLDNPGPP